MIGTAIARRTAIWVMVLWLAALSGFVALTAQWAADGMRADLEDAGRTLHRALSQSAAQHDAHLTSLGALAIASEPPPLTQFGQVAASIVRFYPRILSIRLVDLQGTELAAVGAAGPGSPAMPELDRLERGQVRMLAGGSEGHFRLVKRSSDPEGKLAVIMDVDAAGMFDPEMLPAWGALQLTGADGSFVTGLPPGADLRQAQFRFDKAIASDSQPMQLHLSRHANVGDYILPGPILVFGLGSALIAGLGLMFWSQRQRAREALDVAVAAEARERLRAHEVRLTHASRVNAMGELASGIAHELTQPLTALLSQSQAGLRLIGAQGPDQMALRSVLEANVRQSRRAGDILSRLRAYVTQSEPQVVQVDANDVVSDIALLMQGDLAARDCRLVIVRAEPAAMVAVDPVQLEQVIHNLVRNAAEAMAGSGGEIKVTLSASEDVVRIVVADGGPGIADEAMPRLFEPFYTTKPDGMGLGLSLCQGLVERFGGHIEAANGLAGGAVITVTLPQAAEQEVLQ